MLRDRQARKGGALTDLHVGQAPRKPRRYEQRRENSELRAYDGNARERPIGHLTVKESAQERDAVGWRRHDRTGNVHDGVHVRIVHVQARGDIG